MSDDAVLRELAPTARTLVERHLTNAKEWFPHELVPWSLGREPSGGHPQHALVFVDANQRGMARHLGHARQQCTGSGSEVVEYIHATRIQRSKLRDRCMCDEAPAILASQSHPLPALILCRQSTQPSSPAYSRTRTLLPAEEAEMNFADFPAQSLMEITARPPLVFVRGEGSWLWDHQGKRYLDFVQGWAVNCLGHSPKVITEALIEQSRKLITPSPAFYNEPSIALAQRIVKHSGFHKVFFTNSGAEANEGAIKLARKWGTLTSHMKSRGIEQSHSR